MEVQPHTFLTSALDIGEWSYSRPGCFTPGKRPPPVLLGYETGWDTEPVWTGWRREKNPAPPGNRYPVVQSVD